MANPCTELNCDALAVGRGLCKRHWQHWRRANTNFSPITVTRYEAKVDRLTTPDGCHPWRGCRDRKGYGLFAGTRAHRWGYTHYVGPIPAGHVIRHTCDTPSCQRREHWLPGTYQQNSDDMVKRQRQMKGSAHTAAKLTEADVVEIRKQCTAGASLRSLGERYGVDFSTVGQIVRGEIWRHV